MRVEGRENIPPAAVRAQRPLIVVVNHTAGLDPIVVQVAMPRFFIRWVMGEDMRLAIMEPIWRFVEIITVDRTGKADHGALREMFGHLKPGKALGVFPEGRIPSKGEPPVPFQAGIGLLVARSGALVLPVVLSGTPRTESAWASLGKTSRTVVSVQPPIDYTGRKASEIVADLQTRFRAWTGGAGSTPPSAAR